MRAARFHRHGGPIVIEDIPEPTAAPGEALVEMYTAAVNPLDLGITLGRVAADAHLPRTVGVEGSGYLDGKPVLVHGAGVGVRRDGTWAERVAAPRIAVVPIPAGLPLDVAAACGNAGAAAVRLVQLADARRSERVLVLAASGAVGMAACSLLSSAGIEVWGQIRRSEAADTVQAMGARPVVIAAPEHISEALGGEKPAAVIDCLGAAWTAAVENALDYEGRHVIFGAATGAVVEFNLLNFYRRSGVLRGYAGITEPPERLREGVELALRAVAEGRMQIPIGTRLPFSAAADGLSLIARSHSGKIIIGVRD